MRTSSDPGATRSSSAMATSLLYLWKETHAEIGSIPGTSVVCSRWVLRAPSELQHHLKGHCRPTPTSQIDAGSQASPPCAIGAAVRVMYHLVTRGVKAVRPELAKTTATRYNGGMNQTTLPRMPDLWATVPARQPVP